MKKVVKCKPVDTAEGQFDLVEAFLEGDALTHWMEFKCVETTCISKNSDRMDKLAKAQLQKAYLRNHVKKLIKLSIKNTAAQLREINNMLTHFPVPGNTLMAENELCDIIYCMIKHDWRDALCKSGRTPNDLSFQDL
eukprot:3590648-Ditylum_brightwellii.AAC.1